MADIATFEGEVSCAPYHSEVVTEVMARGEMEA